MALPTDATNSQVLTHDLLNQINSSVNDITDNLQVLATDNAAQNAALTNLQTNAGGTQSNIVAAQTTANSQATQISNLQASATAAQNRLSVLENHNPPPATPGKPTGLTPGTITTTTVQLTWAAPAGTAPTSYVPRHATPPGSGNWVNDPAVTAPTVTTTITGLVPATAYDFSIVPANTAGPGVASDTIMATTLPVITPSPAWTEMPPATRLVMNDGGIVTLVGGVLFLNNINMGQTANVILALKSDTGRIYQEIPGPNWWYWDPTQTQPWVSTSDPRPIISSGAPAIAAAVGYNQQTLGSSPRTGWFVRDGTAVDQPDGSVRLISADGFNGGYATTTLTSGYMGFNGTSFGGGAYFRITAKWSGAGIGGAGFPQLWTRDIEGETGFNLTSVPIQYPGRPNTSNLWFEEVIAYDNGTNANDFGSTLFLYSTEFAAINGALQRKTFPGGFADRTSYHTYGLLWVPATPTARGYMAYCYDDVEYQRVTWDYRANRSTLPTPPAVADLGGNVSLINVGSDIDWRHHFPILGSGSTSPLDVLKTEVWQKNASANIINGQSGGGGGGTTAPAIAAAVGYNTNSFGPDIRVGGANPNWYILDGTAVLQPDGAWRLVSTDGFGGGFGNLKYTGGSFNTITTGTAFGGGLYVRFLARWQGPGGASTGGWPGLWSNDLEGQTAFTNANSPIHYPPGGPAPSNIWHEFDLMEDGPTGTNNNDYGSALHVFTTDYGNLQAAPSRFTWPNGATTRQSYHWYGMLWVPATPTTRGYIAYCFDDVEYQRTSWDYRANRNTLPSPPAVSTLSPNHYLLNTGSEIDSRHLFWLAGSGQSSPVDLMAVEVWQSDTSHNLTVAPVAPPTTSGPGSGPAFQNLTSFTDMGNGQKCSTGMTSNATGVAATGVNELQIKPYEINGIWRGTASGNYIGPLTAAFVDRGIYLYDPDVAKIYSATGCPPVDPNNTSVSGINRHIGWWTAGNITSPIKWGLFYEPNFDIAGGTVYAVINDFNAGNRGDSFHVTANMQGRGVVTQTSWGSILDFSAEIPGNAYGLGWIAFVGYSFNKNQIIADW